VATFLAVLELAKTKKIILNGSMQDMEVSISEEGESVEN
jgi:chromatin segregation and condensation protein Rec8/ScpA/Scc1 (kleisin family)